MEKYTLLLADDEEEVIQIIMRKIDWEGLGFSVIGYANNGVKALEMVEEFQPDVVMTDIKMPYMDGMELSKQIKEEFPATKILIFTGFDEFEYAKEAIHLEIEEYILKPLNSVELSNIFMQLKSKLDQEISDKRNAQTLQNYYMESLPFLQANFYATLIEGKMREEEIFKYLKEYQISFEGPFYSCLVIHTSEGQVPEGMTPQLLFTSVQKLVEDRLVEKWKAKSFSYAGNSVLIVQLEQRQDVSELTDECDRFCRYAQRMVGAVVTVGIGQVCEQLEEVYQSYGSAREAVSYRVLYGASRALNMEEIAPQERMEIDSAHEAELTNLFKMIRLSSEKDIEEAVQQYLNQMSLPTKTIQQHYIAVMELISALYRFAANYGIGMEEFSGDIRNLYSSLMEMEPDTLKKWLIKISLFFQQKIISARSKSTNSFISRAKEYVQNNYGDESLSLDSMCEVLGVSNSYFSSVFKKEEGNSFIGYLTNYRMEKAARLLIETNEKSYMIAKRVGYADANYFSYVFKRQYGVSPSKYRTEYAET